MPQQPRDSAALGRAVRANGDAAAVDERLVVVEMAVRELQQSVRDIERRLAVVESGMAASAAVDAASPADALPIDEDPAAAAAGGSAFDVVAIMSFIGRTFVALGGAYLLRALTDAAILPPRIGIACGLLYGISWLVMADRAAAGGRWLSAVFHTAVTSMIGFPLVWEAVTRFKLLGPETSVSVMTVLTGAALAVAVRQRLQSVAWIVVLPAMMLALMMMAATGFVLSFAVYLIALGVTTLWLGYLPLYWRFLRWPVAFAADLSVMALAMRASTRDWSDPPVFVIAVQLLLLTGYLASIVVRTLIRGRDVIPFEILQTAVALVVGFGGAVYVAAITGAGERALAVINLAAGVGCYAVAFRFIARRQGLRHNFYFYTSLAIVLVVVSTHLMLRREAAASTFGALSILSAWTAWRVRHVALNLHAAGYVVAAASESGLLSSAAYALLAPATSSWLPFTLSALRVLTATLVCWLIPMSREAESWGGWFELPRLIMTVVLTWSVGGAIVALLTMVPPGTIGTAGDPGNVATIRTMVLAVLALGLARVGRIDRFKESAHLVYPVLIAGGLKLVAEDFRYSKPATLFVALAFYGGALILAPRLLRRQTTSG
jgi:hypothetical protein